MITRNRLILSAAAIALVAAGGVAAQSPSNTVQSEQRARPDANGDGNLTRAEATAHATARFARMDANDDGRLTTADRAAARERRRDEMFAGMDADGNGAVTRAEYDAAGEASDARRAERREARAERRGGEERAGAGHRGGRHMGMRGGRGRGGAVALRRADTNNDQAIDSAEFIAAAETRFARADSNSDGTVTAAERQARRASMRDRMGRRGGSGADMPPPAADMTDNE